MMVTMATMSSHTCLLLPLLLLLLLGAAPTTAETPQMIAEQPQKTSAQGTIEDDRGVEFWEELRQKEKDTIPLIKDIIKGHEGDAQSSNDEQQQHQPDDSSSGTLPTDEDVQTDEEPHPSDASDDDQPALPVQEQEPGEADAPVAPPTVSSNITASDVSEAIRHLTVNPDGRQIKSGGSALTAALMIGGPMLAGALYAGANAPSEFVESQPPATPNRRQDGGPSQDQEEDFNWQTLLQRTVGNIRNTASNVQDSVLGFFSTSEDRSNRPSLPNTNLDGSLPPTPLGAAGAGGRPKRRRKRPNAQTIDDEIRIQVPYVGGIPLFPQLGPENQQVNPEAIRYLQQQQQQQHLQQQQQQILQHQQQQGLQEQQFPFIGQQSQILAGPPIPHDYPIDPSAGLLRQQSQGQQAIVGGHGLAHGIHPYNLHGGPPGGHPIQTHGEDPSQHHPLLAASGQPSLFPPGHGPSSVFPPGQGPSAVFPPSQVPSSAFQSGQGPPPGFPPSQGGAPAHHASFDGQNFHLQSQGQQYIRDPSTGQIIDVNSLSLKNTVDGVRRFDGRDREEVPSVGGLRRFDERQARNPLSSAAGASTLITSDGSSKSSFGPLKISDALEHEPPNRERGQIREQKELGIEGLESIPTVHVIKNSKAISPMPVGRKIQAGFDVKTSSSQLIDRSDNPRTGPHATVPYVSKEGSIHFLEVPERYGEMRRLRRPMKGKQRRRKGGPGGSRIRTMKPRIKPNNSEQLKRDEELSKTKSSVFSRSGSNLPKRPLRAFNHKYSTSSEERSIIEEYMNPTDFKRVPGRLGSAQLPFVRGPFLGKTHSPSPFLGAGSVGVTKVPEVPEKITNFTTSFRVFDLENAQDMQKSKGPMGRITYTQIYGEVKPESLLTNPDLSSLKAGRPDLPFRDDKQVLYQRPDLYGYGRPQTNNGDPHYPHDFHVGERKEDRFVIGGNHHRKITDPKTLPPSMLANEIEERSDISSKEATLFRDDFASSSDSLPVPSIISRNRESGSREFNTGSKQRANDHFSIDKQFRMPPSLENIRRLDENRKRYTSSDSDTSKNPVHRMSQSDYEDVSNEPISTPFPSLQYPRDPSVERNFVNREFETRNRPDGLRDSTLEKLRSINLGELSPRQPLNIQPASFEVYEFSAKDKTSVGKQYSQENEYYPLDSSKNQRTVPKPQNVFRDRNPPSLPPRPSYENINPNRRKTPAPARRTTTEYRESERFGIKEPSKERATKLRSESEEHGERIPGRSEQEINSPRRTTISEHTVSKVNKQENMNRRRRPSVRESLRLQESEGRRSLSAELDTYIRSKTRLPERETFERDQSIGKFAKSEISRERIDDRDSVGPRTTVLPSKRKSTDAPQRMRPTDLPRLDDSDGPFALGMEKTNQAGSHSAGRDRTDEDTNERQTNRRRKPGRRRRKRIRKPQSEDMTDVARVAEKRIRSNQMKIAHQIDEGQSNFQEDLRFGVNFDPFEPIQEGTLEAMDESSSENRRRRGPNPDSGYSSRRKEIGRLEKPSPVDPYKSSANTEPTYVYSGEKFGKRQRRLTTRRPSQAGSRGGGDIQYDKLYSHYPSGEEDRNEGPSNIRKRYSDYTSSERFRSNMQSHEWSSTFLGSGETGFSERIGYDDNSSRNKYDSTVEFLKAKRDNIGRPSYFSPEQKIQIKPIPVSSFTSDDATVLPTRFTDMGLQQSIREKIDKRNEPSIITIGDIRSGTGEFSNQNSFESTRTRRQPYSSQKEVGGFMKRIQDDISSDNDPIISNFKAMFMENVPESHKRVKTPFWEREDSSSNTRLDTGSFVDPSGRVNHPVRSFNLPTSKPFPHTFGPNFGSIENLERHHLTPQDLFDKDRNNFATVVMSSELSYGGGPSRVSSRGSSSGVSSDIVTGRISHNSRPRIPHRSQYRSNNQAMRPRDEPQYESLLNLLPQKLIAERPGSDNALAKKNSERFSGKSISFETTEEPNPPMEKLKTNVKPSLVSGSKENFNPSADKTVHGPVDPNLERTVSITDNKSSLIAAQSKMFKLSQDFSVVQTPKGSNDSPRRVLKMKEKRKVSKRSSGEAISSVAQAAKPSLMSLFPFSVPEPSVHTVLIEKHSAAVNTDTAST